MISKSSGEGGKHRSNRIIMMHSEHILSYKKGMQVHVCISSLCISNMDHIASHCGNTLLSSKEGGDSQTYFSKHVWLLPGWRQPWKSKRLKSSGVLPVSGFPVF